MPAETIPTQHIKKTFQDVCEQNHVSTLAYGSGAFNRPKPLTPSKAEIHASWIQVINELLEAFGVPKGYDQAKVVSISNIDWVLSRKLPMTDETEQHLKRINKSLLQLFYQARPLVQLALVKRTDGRGKTYCRFGLRSTAVIKLNEVYQKLKGLSTVLAYHGDNALVTRKEYLQLARHVQKLSLADRKSQPRRARMK